MKATLHAGENVRTRIGKIVGDGMYIRVCATELPEGFIQYSENRYGTKVTLFGVMPVSGYDAAMGILSKLNNQED